eukprot:TRINITY_DN60366_c0_g1_i1.p1 TRINITY_DN60366_c0_g1~~TRINITY_DN60366_c0_g1_i1.p1  ORF type:complete len:273 (-),score=95.92 TRINITY_DN60366_c0_g1_i1:192-1010(-)
MAAAEQPVVNEIEALLDQCSPEELTNILQAIEGEQAGGVPAEAGAPVMPRAPVPPAAPPPSSGARRPVPGNLKAQAAAGTGGAEAASGPSLGMDDVKAMLDQHSAMVLNEVRKLIPAGTSAEAAYSAPPQPLAVVQPGSDGIDMETLTKVLVDRDNEVKELEAKLAELQDVLSQKDKRLSDLGGELDHAVREVRHRQLDLEFQQLKLEERVRSNAELEQAHRMLTAKVEEANLNARHAALDVELCRQTPRSVRVQGSLPWTLRKNRLPGSGL